MSTAPEPIPIPPWLAGDPALPGVIDWYERVRASGHDVPTVLRLFDLATRGRPDRPAPASIPCPEMFLDVDAAAGLVGVSNRWLRSVQNRLPSGVMVQAGPGKKVAFHRDNLVRWAEKGKRLRPAGGSE